MSIVVRFVPSATIEQYDESVRRMEETGDFPPDGMEVHVCFTGPDGDVRVSEIWDSREQFEAFGERLMPLLAEVGIDAGAPDVFEVHRVVTR